MRAARGSAPPILPLGRAAREAIRSQQAFAGPADAVEELICNSIDAGATSVCVRVLTEDALSFEVSDNGSGIAPADFRFVCRTHWTTKRAGGGSAGCRGEALAAIAAVSRQLRVTTRARGAAGSQSKLIERGSERWCGDDPPPGRPACGTTVSVRGLLDGLPVRRAAQHGRRGLDEVVRAAGAYACAHAGAALRLEGPCGGTVFAKPAAESLLAAFAGVHGDARAQSLAEVAAATPHWVVQGVVSAGGGGGDPVQLFVVNGRPCCAPQPAAALQRLYGRARGPAAPPSPSWVLRVACPAGEVDIPAGCSSRVAAAFRRPHGLVTLLCSLAAAELRRTGHALPRTLGNVDGVWVNIAPAPACPPQPGGPPAAPGSPPRPPRRGSAPPTPAAVLRLFGAPCGAAGEGAPAERAGLCRAEERAGAPEAKRPRKEGAEGAGTAAAAARQGPGGYSGGAAPRRGSSSSVWDSWGTYTVPGAEEAAALRTLAPEPRLPDSPDQAHAGARVPWWRRCALAAAAPPADPPGATGEEIRLPRAAVEGLQLRGQAMQRFLVCTTPHGDNQVLVVVDQHAADERVKLEYLQEGLPRMCRPAPLDPPVELQVSATEDAPALRVGLPALQKWGWSARLGAGGEVVVRSCPALHFPEWAARPRVAELTDPDELLRAARACGPGGVAVPLSIMRVLQSKACRSAVMFGDTLTPEQQRRLLRQLARTRDPFHCAHGRPAVVPVCTLPPPPPPRSPLCLPVPGLRQWAARQAGGAPPRLPAAEPPQPRAEPRAPTGVARWANRFTPPPPAVSTQPAP
eukprot:TRINITY_DN1426_c1_g1_i2.p1 TRINITY_DN1426_c1_g1~~TRINITY_DN1426_c1_g1_i2.p1  ORF type:complete len:828 (+),score=194.07 TRINITY_DN1426_c1_g1_i2:87-2486(+)